MNFNKYVILSLCAFYIFAGCKSTVNKEFTAFDFSYQDKWHYFNLEDTTSVKVINHLAAEALCGNMAFGSITIATRSDGDTIRIINLCNTEKYKANDLITFKPAENPGFSVHLPYSTIFNDETNEIEPSMYDRNILETTYGYALRNDQ